MTGSGAAPAIAIDTAARCLAKSSAMGMSPGGGGVTLALAPAPSTPPGGADPTGLATSENVIVPVAVPEAAARFGLDTRSFVACVRAPRLHALVTNAPTTAMATSRRITPPAPCAHPNRPALRPP